MRAYIWISGTLFGVVALMHALRLLQGWPIDVAGRAVPIWISAAALLVTGVLSIWAFRVVGQVQK
jgi:lipid-A-disaccharide synthase-like uncharacterized protein